ncbi:MAG: M3 family metallopeptidase [Lentisphaerae bacterium]|nr:M3 family metallopeptidase [Lentisphaerota bacterium]
MNHPFLDPAFNPPWSRLAAACVEPEITEALRRAQAKLDAVAALGDADLTFDQVLLGFESATRELSHAWHLVNHLNAVCNAPDIRQALNAMLPQVTAFFTRVPLDPKLWRVIKAYAATPEAGALTGVHKRFLEETLLDFRESGADLPDDQKRELEQLNAELAQHTQKFSENVLDATNAWDKVVTDEAELAGLPESARAAARQAARQKEPGTDAAPAWRFTLHQPSLLPVLQYAERDAFRRELWQASADVGRLPPHDNSELVRNILELRQAKARLLGFRDFADLATCRRMVRNGDAALCFVRDLHDRIDPFFRQDAAQLEAYRAAHDAAAPAVTRLKPWQLSYWTERQRQARYDFNPEALRPYLPMPRVIAGMFALAERLFGITFRPRPTVCFDPATGVRQVRSPAAGAVAGAGEPIEVWHPEVEYIDVYDGPQHLGAFYCDWHPRPSKRGGAWMDFLHTGGPQPDGSRAPHLGLMCGNLTPPVDGKPALLTHDEVTTVFHEFGHLLHHLLSDVPIESLSGVRVAWDFVELPSQLMESWCWEPAGLDLFARHHETGAPVPPELLERLLRSRRYRSASAMMGQLAYSLLDLDLHIHLEQVRGLDWDQHWRTRVGDYLTPVDEPGPAPTRRFSHLFGHATGYAAGYYSYKWAEVLAADVFTRFKHDGVLNGQTGRALRETILSRGNAEPPDNLFRAFMGRDPDLNALLEREGLQAPC